MLPRHSRSFSGKSFLSKLKRIIGCQIKFTETWRIVANSRVEMSSSDESMCEVATWSQHQIEKIYGDSLGRKLSASHHTYIERWEN